MDINSIDFVGFNGHNRPRNTLTTDFVEQTLALEQGARLGIGEAVDAAVWMKDHGAGHHRTGQAAAADFVDARHRHEPVAVEAVLNIPSRADLGHSYELYAPHA